MRELVEVEDTVEVKARYATNEGNRITTKISIESIPDGTNLAARPHNEGDFLDARRRHAYVSWQRSDSRWAILSEVSQRSHTHT